MSDYIRLDLAELVARRRPLEEVIKNAPADGLVARCSPPGCCRAYGLGAYSIKGGSFRASFLSFGAAARRHGLEGYIRLGLGKQHY